MNLSLSLVTLVLCLATLEVKACMVAFAHPQSIYCRSDYAIEVLVGERRNVYLEDDGSFEIAPENIYGNTFYAGYRRRREVDSELVELSQAEPILFQPEIVSTSDITSDEVRNVESDAGNEMGAIILQEELPALIIPDIVSVTDNDDQEEDDIKSEIEPSKSEPTEGKGVPPTPKRSFGFPTTQYSITIRKVFKGNVTKDESYLYTATSDAMCGVHLKENTPHLIMGYIRQNILYINLAGYTLDLTTLNDAELLHIADNAGKYFKQGCQDCYVNTCNRKCPEQIPLTNQCIWRNPFSLFDTRASQLACVHTEEGICDWYNAMEPTMVPSDLD